VRLGFADLNIGLAEFGFDRELDLPGGLISARTVPSSPELVLLLKLAPSDLEACSDAFEILQTIHVTGSR